MKFGPANHWVREFNKIMTFDLVFSEIGGIYAFLWAIFSFCIEGLQGFEMEKQLI